MSPSPQTSSPDGQGTHGDHDLASENLRSSLPRTPSHSLLLSFVKEPAEDGNRNVMLPDQTSDGNHAVERARVRMAQRIQQLDAVQGNSTG
ncbi:Uu.00g035190.m01.CDS01 [Anthostomella pinea]|uniref:Uu.00g035190.m01.CDS01 n=1 Tax=Anthostomella pinea TaxID=933095 RepID=A0AAI8VA79_9PEZI|nr:Uu.00g035190.m01.CDS01 [Anthostomella pinea]